MATSTSLKKDISQRKVLLEKVEREAALVEEVREALRLHWRVLF